MKKFMKMTLCMLLCAAMVYGFAACTPRTAPTLFLSGETVTLSGVWVLDDTLDMHERTFEEYNAEQRKADVNFTCGGEKYTRIFWACTNTGTALIKGLTYTEYSSYDPVPWTYCAYQEGRSYLPNDGWQGEEYKTLDFGAEPQSVSKEFYDWFSANATQVA